MRTTCGPAKTKGGLPAMFFAPNSSPVLLANTDRDSFVMLLFRRAQYLRYVPHSILTDAARSSSRGKKRTVRESACCFERGIRSATKVHFFLVDGKHTHTFHARSFLRVGALAMRVRAAIQDHLLPHISCRTPPSPSRRMPNECRQGKKVKKRVLFFPCTFRVSRPSAFLCGRCFHPAVRTLTVQRSRRAS